MLSVDCRVCGKAFSTKRSAARYCSDACRTEAKLRHNSEYVQKYLADPEKRAIALARARATRAARSAKKEGAGRRPRARRAAGSRPRAAPKSAACRLCGRTFEQYGGTSHAYCKACTAKADRAAALVMRVDCKACGKKFSTANRSVRYCSDACSAEGLRRSRHESERRRMADPEKRAVAMAHVRAWSAARKGEKAGRAGRRRT